MGIEEEEVGALPIAGPDIEVEASTNDVEEDDNDDADKAA
jgi:hypothetical protein